MFRLTNANNAAFAGVTLGFGAIAAALSLGWYGEWREPDCQGVPVQSIASPSGELRAVHEQSACASTDALHTTVAIAGGRFGDGRMVFSAVSGDALGAMAIGQRAPPLIIRWESDESLLIVHPAGLAPQAQTAPEGLTVRAFAGAR